MKNLMLPLALFLCALVFLAGQARAAEKNLSLSAQVGVMYDSNVFLAPDDEDSDLITVLGAKVGVRAAVGSYGRLTAAFGFTGNIYSDYSDGDVITQDHAVNLTFQGDKYHVVFEDTFIFDSYPIDTVLLGRVDNWLNTLRAAVGARYDKLGWELGGRVRVLQYPDIPAYDYTDSSLYIEGSYIYSSKTDFFVRVTFGTIDYRLDEHNEPDYVDAKVGVRGTLSDKTDYELGAGWQRKDYDKSGTIADSSDYSGFSLSGKLDYAASEKTSFAFLVSYGPSESVLSNYNKVFYIAGGMRHDFTRKITGDFSLGYERSTNSDSSDNDFDKVVFDAKVSYALNDRSSVLLKMKWESRSSDDPLREYDRLLTGLFYEVRF